MKIRKTKKNGLLGLCLLWLLVYPIAGLSQTATPTTAVLAPITVNDTTNSIRVDGYLVDWPITRMILLNQKSQVTYGILNWKNKDDFSGRIFMTYDDQYLYLSAIVQKPSGIVNDNSGMALWDGDCIELFLSAYSMSDQPNRISKGDYHIGFTPGTGGNNPRMFCFNKENTIGGGRVAARPTGHGYILEACVPLTYFEGLEIGPGKTTRFDLALDEGGSISGNRMLQLDLTGHSESWQNPSLWGSIQWIGKTEISVPRNDETDLYSNLVLDGTKGATYWGRRMMTGLVIDDQGKPIAGAMISTWPRTQSALSDKNGQFDLGKVKVYDKTVVYARAEGYQTSLASIERKPQPVTVSLKLLPAFLTSDNEEAGPAFYGQSFQVPADGNLLGMMVRVQDWVKMIPLNVLKLVGTELLSQKKEEQYQALDQFVDYARQLRAEPMIELPIHQTDPAVVADWIYHCNVDKKEHVAYWTVGDEPDLYADKRAGTEFEDYNVYDYINDFRAVYNAAKKVDPSILVLGPELAWRYTSGENDWLTPFIQFDGDIVNLISIHHYGSVSASQCSPENIMDDVRRLQTLSRDIQSRIAMNADTYIPMVITGGNVCMESTDNTLTAMVSPAPTVSAAAAQPLSTMPTPSTMVVSKNRVVSKNGSQTPASQKDCGPNSFWAALWEADQLGTLMKDGMPMAFLSYLSGNGPLDFLTAQGAKPDYWVFRLMSATMKGKVIWTQVENKNTSVYATQDPQTKDVHLMILNKSGSYYHPKILLNAHGANISVDAGLNQTFDFEMPYYSIAFLTIKADKSQDEAVLYTREMALAGNPPAVSVIQPW